MSKSLTKVTTFPADTMQDIGKTDLVQLSRNLLGSVVQSTDALTPSAMNEQRVKDLRLVLGFLNATNNVIKTKMTYFKMTGIGQKIDAIKKKAKEVQ